MPNRRLLPLSDLPWLNSAFCLRASDDMLIKQSPIAAARIKKQVGSHSLYPSTCYWHRWVNKL